MMPLSFLPSNEGTIYRCRHFQMQFFCAYIASIKIIKITMWYLFFVCRMLFLFTAWFHDKQPTLQKAFLCFLHKWTCRSKASKMINLLETTFYVWKEKLHGVQIHCHLQMHSKWTEAIKKWRKNNFVLISLEKSAVLTTGFPWLLQKHEKNMKRWHK